MSEKFSPCVLEEMMSGFMDGKDHELMKFYLAYTPIAEIILATKIFDDDGELKMSLYCDPQYDEESIIDNDEEFWCFANSYELKKGVLQNLNREYDLCNDKAQAIFLAISTFKRRDVVIPKVIFYELTSWVTQIKPPKEVFKTSLTIDNLKDPKYKDLILSDQHRHGYCACGICVFNCNNPIIHLNNFSHEWWNKHTESDEHKQAVEQKPSKI